VFNSLDVTVTGDASAATVTNSEPFAVDVYVKAGSEASGAGTSGPITVEPGESVSVTGTADKDISAIGIVCEGFGTPDFPPFTLPNEAASGPGDAATTDGNRHSGPIPFSIEVTDTGVGNWLTPVAILPALAALGAFVFGRRP